jgi:hypothetical protein
MKGEFVYANGYNISQARKLFKFYFGDFFFKAEKNDKKMRFDVYLKNRIKGGKKEVVLSIEEYVDLEYFNSFWNGTNQSNPPFNVMVVDVQM